MPDARLSQEIVSLTDTLNKRFSQPEFISGCQVTGTADINEYATNNGWITAVCGPHNEQRVRWKSGETVGTASYIDVIHFPSYHLFEAWGLGGTASINVSGGGGWPTAGKAMIDNTEYASIPAALSAAVGGDIIKVGQGADSGGIAPGTACAIVGLSPVETIITHSDNNSVTVSNSAANLTLKSLTVAHTGAGTSVVCIQSDQDGLVLDGLVIDKISGTPTNSTGVVILGGTGTGTLIKNCKITVSSGTNKYGMSAGAACNIVIEGGEINAATADIYIGHASAVVELRGVKLSGGGINNASSGTIKGWYYDSNDNMVFVGASDIKGVASNTPDLGSTTAAEQWGNIYQAITKDTFPSGDASGLANRSIYSMNPNTNASNCTEDFNGGLTAGVWTGWAGSPFSTPTLSYTSPSSVMKMTFSGGGAARAFLYSTANLQNTRQARVALFCHTVSTLIGLRMDDGTDNNYCEALLRYVVINQFDWILRTRAGGGAPSITSLRTIELPEWSTVHLWPYGTFWSNWSMQNYLFFDCPGSFVNGVSGFTWTATRAGITYELPAGGADWEAGYVDWFDIV